MGIKRLLIDSRI